MNKTDKIGYYNRETGEELSEEEFKNILSEDKRKKFVSLTNKFRNDNITKDELVELMKMLSKKTDFKVLYDSFYKVNMNKDKPEKITDGEYGKFFRLLNFLSYKNTLAFSNGKNLSKRKIAEFLNFRTLDSLGKYLRKLQKEKMVAFLNLGGIDYLIINPAYAQRNMKLNYTVFELFKDDLIEFLDVYTIKLLELEEDDFEINTIFALDV